MKKVIFLFAILFVLASCNTEKKKALMDVQSFMDKTYGDLVKVNVTEVVAVDSIYSPSLLISSIGKGLMSHRIQFKAYIEAAENAQSIEEFNSLIESAVQISDSTESRLLDKCLLDIQQPDLPSLPKNSKAVKAKFTDGKEEGEAWFYYEIDADTIAHSSSQMKKDIQDMQEMIRKLTVDQAKLFLNKIH